jgi:hypothetical protein
MDIDIDISQNPNASPRFSWPMWRMTNRPHRPTCQRAPHVVILLPEGNMPKSSQIYSCILTWCSSDDLIFAGYLTHFAGYTHQFGWVKVLNPTIFPLKIPRFGLKLPGWTRLRAGDSGLLARTLHWWHQTAEHQRVEGAVGNPGGYPLACVIL